MQFPILKSSTMLNFRTKSCHQTAPKLVNFSQNQIQEQVTSEN